MNNSKNISIIGFAKDLPNICSLAGLLCAMFAIYFSIEGHFQASIISALWSVLFDWFDGIIARNMKGRTKEQSEFGIQLDSMIDIVSFGVYPAIFILSYTEYNVWFIIVAFLVVASCVLRLTYFNIYGLIDINTYSGLSMDNNIIILAFVFLFESFFEHAIFEIILCALLLGLMVLNLSSIPIPKLAGKWIYVLIFYVVSLTSVYSWMIYDMM